MTPIVPRAVVTAIATRGKLAKAAPQTAGTVAGMVNVITEKIAIAVPKIAEAVLLSAAMETSTRERLAILPLLVQPVATTEIHALKIY